MKNKIKNILSAIEDELSSLSTSDKIQAINEIKLKLHELSPLKNNPVDCVVWIKSDLVHANKWNPNHVSAPELKLLEHSIDHDGYTQPVVTMKIPNENFEVVDGWHRSKIGKESEIVRDKTLGYLPIVIIRNDNMEENDRMASTIRHNRARGKHVVAPMITIISDLFRKGWNDDRIAKELGMDKDEVLRLKQNVGLPEMFKNHEWSKSWD